MQVVGIIFLLCGTIHLILNKNYFNILNQDILSVPSILLIYGFSLSTISSLGILGAGLRQTGVMRCYVLIIVNILIVKAILCLWFYQCIEEVKIMSYHSSSIDSTYNRSHNSWRSASERDCKALLKLGLRVSRKHGMLYSMRYTWRQNYI